MAISYSRVVLAGHLGADPILTDADGPSACRFVVGISTAGSGGLNFVECFAVDRLADVAASFLQRGDGVLLEGRLQAGGVLVESIRSLASGASLEGVS